MNKRIWKIIEPWVYLIAIGLALLLVVLRFDVVWDLLVRMFKMLTPLYYGFGIAFVLNVPMKKIETMYYTKFPNTKKKGYVRSLAILLSIVLAIVIISVVVVSIAPQIVTSVITLLTNAQTYVNNIIAFVNTVFEQLHLEYRFDIDSLSLLPWNEYMEQILKNLQAMMNTYGNAIVSNVKGFTITLGNFFMGFMLSIYLLGGKEKFIAQAKKLVVAIFGLKHSQRILRIATMANETFENFISGQLVEMMVLSIIFYIGLSLFNMPYALLIAVITGISGIIPILGATMAMVFGAILILGINPIKAVWFIILYQVIQQFENNVVYPRIVGKSVGIDGIWVLLAIIIFGDLFGAVGMILAVPSMAVIYSLVSELVEERIKYLNAKQLKAKENNE